MSKDAFSDQRRWKGATNTVVPKTASLYGKGSVDVYRKPIIGCAKQNFEFPKRNDVSPLLRNHGLHQISRVIHVVALHHGHVIGEQL